MFIKTPKSLGWFEFLFPDTLGCCTQPLLFLCLFLTLHLSPCEFSQTPLFGGAVSSSISSNWSQETSERQQKKQPEATSGRFRSVQQAPPAWNTSQTALTSRKPFDFYCDDFMNELPSVQMEKGKERRQCVRHPQQICLRFTIHL